MLKSLINIIIALVLSFSIVGPSMVNYIASDSDIVEIVDFGEEEKKEVEKKEEKVLNDFQISIPYSFYKKMKVANFQYLASYLDITQDVIIPPPDVA